MSALLILPGFLCNLCVTVQLSKCFKVLVLVSYYKSHPPMYAFKPNIQTQGSKCRLMQSGIEPLTFTIFS